MASTRKVVIAIDFGTTYSGYAYSFSDNSKKIHIGYNFPMKFYATKVPTSILCDPSKNFYAFGYEAEDKYSELLLDEEADGWSLFSRFKMILYNNEDLSAENTSVMDITGTISMPAIDIFAMVIRHMKDHAMQTVKSGKGGANIRDREMYFIITVPAIWEDLARQFMRKAAVRAGIPELSVGLVLESEAASIWCQEMVLVLQDGKPCDISKIGSKYMVVDVGGGTADITVHEKMRNSKLRELLKASGGDWGGKQVDDAFLKILTEALGSETVDLFKKECVGDFLDLMYQFELAKTINDVNSEKQVKIRLPYVLNDMKKKATSKSMTRSFIESLHRLDANKGISIEKDKLRVEADVVRHMFQYSVNGLCKEIQSILTKMDGLKSILVVGGFSESPVVEKAISSLLKGQNVALIFPPEPSLIVLRGAVMYGHTPEIIASRKARFTYGLKTTIPFDEKIHCMNNSHIKTKQIGGKLYCTNHFQVLINMGDDIKNKDTIVFFHESSHSEQKCVTFELYICKIVSPTYVDEPGCRAFQRVSTRSSQGSVKVETMLSIEDNDMFFVIKHIQSGKEEKHRFDFM